MPDIRSDFTQFVAVPPERFEWVRSPGGEVERMMLDRIGDEVAVATSLVRYPPGARFPAHEHGRGEEFLVLEGEFGDEHGRYPVGTYVRNPPGSRHTPFSDPGCVIWVKLRQFHPDDDRQVVVALEPAGGTARQELHRFRDEVVTALVVAAEQVVELPARDQVQEVLVIDGAVRCGRMRVGRWGWLRVPAGEGVVIHADSECHLLHKTRPAFALSELGD